MVVRLRMLLYCFYSRQFMGEAESRERRMQSVPCLHPQETEAIQHELEKAREPLFRRDPNIMEHEFDREDKKEPVRGKQKVSGQLRLKKAKDLMKTIRENDQENEDIQDLNLRRKEQRSNKKSAKKECIHESKTVPVMPLLHVGCEPESRGRRFKVSRML